MKTLVEWQMDRGGQWYVVSVETVVAAAGRFVADPYQVAVEYQTERPEMMMEEGVARLNQGRHERALDELRACHQKQ
jgi:hypothetical protein